MSSAPRARSTASPAAAERQRQSSAVSQQARSWLRELHFELRRLVELSGDVSPRRYFRAEMRRGRSKLVAFYPVPLREAMTRFKTSTELLETAGVRVPRIEAEDAEAGFMLLEDVGTRTLFDRRDELQFAELARLLLLALPTVGRIASLDRQAVAALNGPLDLSLLEQELDQTWDVFLEPAGLGLEDALGSELRDCLRALNRELHCGPQAPCHRDLMVRNLIEADNGEIVVLDHQDLRLGPAGYDLASLLNDSFQLPIAWCRDVAAPASALDAHDVSEVQLARCAVQRGFKILGTFHRFAQSGEPRYLPLVAPTLERTLEHLGRGLGETALVDALRSRLSQ